MILSISLLSGVIFPFSIVFFKIWIFSLLILVNLTNCLSIFLVFKCTSYLFYWIFAIIYLFSINFFSDLYFPSLNALWIGFSCFSTVFWLIAFYLYIFCSVSLDLLHFRHIEYVVYVILSLSLYPESCLCPKIYFTEDYIDHWKACVFYHRCVECTAGVHSVSLIYKII